MLGVCGNHLGGRALAAKVLRACYLIFANYEIRLYLMREDMWQMPKVFEATTQVTKATLLFRDELAFSIGSRIA